MNPSPTPHAPSGHHHHRRISRADLATTFRRAGPIYAPHPQHTQAVQQQQALHQLQIGAQQIHQIRQSDAARAKATHPTDRALPDELRDVIVGDGVARYEKLRAVERKLDAVMMRKRLDVSDNMQRRYTRREGVLRVWVSNSAEGQPWQVMEEEGMGFQEDGTFRGGLDFGDASAATFRVKIEGRLVEDGMWDVEGKSGEGKRDGGAQQQSEGEEKEEKREASSRRPRLSHFFKSITVDFDRNPALQPDGYSAIEWRKPMPGSPGYDPNSSDVSFDTLEFERKGDENINITISLVRDEKYERFKLSPLLAEILDTEEEDRAGAVQGIWEYCRAMGLQEDEDRRSIVCDEQLRRASPTPQTTQPPPSKLTSVCVVFQLFQADKIYFPHVPDKLFAHLQPLPPIQLHYTIRVDQFYINGTPPTTPPSEPTIYTIRIPLQNPLPPTLTNFAQKSNQKSYLLDLQHLTKLDSDLALLVQKVHQTNAKRKFYENLAKDPGEFVKRWTGSQKRDLEVVLAEERNSGEGEEWRRGGEEGVWGGERARESVGLWAARMGKGV